MLTKKYGADFITTGSDTNRLAIERFSTGSFDLDMALNGGFPVGRITEIVGAKSAGKSTLCLIASRHYLERFPDSYVVYLDMERTFDPKWASTLGVDCSRVTHLSPRFGEEAVDMIADIVKEAEGGPLVIIDSIAAITPVFIAEEDSEKATPGRHPMLIGRLISKILPHMGAKEAPQTTVLMVNQIREKIGVMYGNPQTSPGGRAREHASSVQLTLRRKSLIDNGETKDNKKVVGIEVAAKVTKNKCGGEEQAQCVYTLYVDDYKDYTKGTIDNLPAIVKHGLRKAVFEIEGRTYSFGDIKSVGATNFMKALAKDEETINEAVRLIREDEFHGEE
jgi:recombination protein RecA